MAAPERQARARPGSVERDQRVRLQVLTVAATSYTLDAVWLASYSLLGVVSPWVPALYLALAAGVIAAFYLLFSRGWNLRYRDGDLALAQSLAAASVTIGFLVAVPQAGIFFLLNLFVVFAFASVSVTPRQFLPAWLLVSIATGAVLLTRGDAVGLPLATPAEQTVSGLAFASMLGRTLVLALRVSGLRGKLHRRNLALHDAKEQAERLARVDELTQVLNRRTFFEIVDEEARRNVRSRRPFCIALIDLDHFKSVNDRFGHVAGDQVLVEFAAIVGRCLRSTDKLGRYGGEEFVVLLPETPLAGGRVVMERIRAAIAAADWTAIAPDLAVTVSIGVAVHRLGDTVDQFVDRADRALYTAKREGRNRTAEG